jgi:hypothetical protein
MVADDWAPADGAASPIISATATTAVAPRKKPRMLIGLSSIHPVA